MFNNDPMRVLTGEVRLSYVHLNEPYANKNNTNGKAKYSTTILIPKTDTTTRAEIDAAFKAAYEDGVTNKWKGARPVVKNPLIYDGDGVRTDGQAFGPECKGHWVITASCADTRKPQVVDMSNINVQLPPEQIYSGMYARVTIRFYPFDTAGNKGVGCGLGNVMKTRDGEPLSGGTTAAADFAGIGQVVQSDFAGVGNGGYTPQTAQPYIPPQPYAQPAPQYGQPQQAYPSIDPITGQPTGVPW